MSLDSLRDNLEYLRVAIPRRSAARSLVLMTKDDGEFPRMKMNEYVHAQQCCLDALEKAANEATGQGKVREDCCLFACGSAARLEYVSRKSDIDVLAVLKKRPSLNELQEEDGLRLLHDEVSSFDLLEAALKDVLCPRLGMDDPKGELEILDRAPILGCSSYFTRDELVTRLGAPYEASWAAMERAQLLFGAAWLGGDRVFAGELRTEADSVYGVTQDIREKHVPITGCCLVEMMAKSGALTKLAKVRQDAHNDQYAADAEMIKAVFLRVWSGAINSLTLQALYWCGRVATIPELQDRDKLLGIIRTPPIMKVLHTIPWFTRKAFEAGGWEAAFQKRSDAADAKQLCRRIYLRLSHCSECSPPGPPFWYRFLQMQELYKQVREGGRQIEGGVEKWVRDRGRELEHVLELAGALTKELSDPETAVDLPDSHYDKCARLLMNAVYPDTVPASAARAQGDQA